MWNLKRSRANTCSHTGRLPGCRGWSGAECLSRKTFWMSSRALAVISYCYRGAHSNSQATNSCHTWIRWGEQSFTCSAWNMGDFFFFYLSPYFILLKSITYSLLILFSQKSSRVGNRERHKRRRQWALPSQSLGCVWEKQTSHTNASQSVWNYT